MDIRIFKTRAFGRWARKTRLTDESLLRAVEEMLQGLVEADLGGNLFKKRVPLPGKGKRGSTRVIIATRVEARWFFLAGFKKNAQDDLSPDELDTLKGYAQMLLDLDDTATVTLLANGKLEELNHAR